MGCNQLRWRISWGKFFLYEDSYAKWQSYLLEKCQGGQFKNDDLSLHVRWWKGIFTLSVLPTDTSNFFETFLPLESDFVGGVGQEFFDRLKMFMFCASPRVNTGRAQSFPQICPLYVARFSNRKEGGDGSIFWLAWMRKEFTVEICFLASRSKFNSESKWMFFHCFYSSICWLESFEVCINNCFSKGNYEKIQPRISK